MIKLRLLRWRDHSGLSGEPNVTTRVLMRGRQEDQSERDMRMEAESDRFKDIMLALKMEGEPKNVYISLGWKRQGNRFSPRASGRNAVLPTPSL